MLSYLAVIYTVIYTIGIYVGIIGTIGTYGGSLYTMLVTVGLCYVHTYIYTHTIWSYLMICIVGSLMVCNVHIYLIYYTCCILSGNLLRSY